MDGWCGAVVCQSQRNTWSTPLQRISSFAVVTSKTPSAIEKKEPTVNSCDENLPIRIEHLVDTCPTAEDGSYYYNYLLYTFEHAGGVITARSYLDDTSEVHILECSTDIDLEGELTGTLEYLRRRYSTVKRLGPRGYSEV